MGHREGVLCLSSARFFVLFQNLYLRISSEIIGMASKSFQVRGPKWEGAIGLFREPMLREEMLICCLSHMLPGFPAAHVPYLGYPETSIKWSEMKWGCSGLYLVGLSVMRTQAVLRSDPSSWQLPPPSMNRGDHMLFSPSDIFYLVSRSSSPEKVSAGLAYLHPHFQVWKAGVHLQSLSIISLCIKPVHA